MTDLEKRAGAASTAIIEPDLPIIDSHHHLWVTPKQRYLIEEFQADLATGHNVIATVFVDCDSMYRKAGPPELRSVGEAEFVAGVAAMSESGLFGPTRICASYVGAADLTLGEKALDGIIEKLKAASGGRLSSIRGNVKWDPDKSVHTAARPMGPPDLMYDKRFRAGVARLTAHNLVYESSQNFPQLPLVCDLADAVPDTTIVIDHCGGMLGINAYDRPDNFSIWKSLVTEAARRPNAMIKVGGISQPRCNFAFHKMTTRPQAEDLARDWRPYFETCIELFGPERCMFESNFPPDKAAGTYDTVWNAMKLVAAQYTAAEKRHLFSETARRAFKIADAPA